MAKKSKAPSAGMRKAINKADKISGEKGGEVKRAGHGYTDAKGKKYSDGGQVSIETDQFNPTGGTTKRPVVMGGSDWTGELRTFPVKGKLSKFKQNTAKAESRATAFINASTQGKLFEGR